MDKTTHEELRYFIKNNVDGYVAVVRGPASSKNRFHKTSCCSFQLPMMEQKEDSPLHSDYKLYTKSQLSCIKQDYPEAQSCIKCKP